MPVAITIRGRMTTHDGPSIRVDQLLKHAGIAASGGQAKVMIQGGQVKVNGEIDTRRGRKLREGDSVEASGQTVVVDAALLRGTEESEKP